MADIADVAYIDGKSEIKAKFENCISKNKANVHTCTGTLVPSYFYHKKSTMLVTARNPLRFPSFENEKMLSSIL